MKWFISAAVVFTLSLFPASINAQRAGRAKSRNSRATQARLRSVLLQIEREQLAEFRNLHETQKEAVGYLLRRLERAVLLYDATGDARRADAEFFNESDQALLEAVNNFLPRGRLRGDIRKAVTTLADAITLHKTYGRTDARSNQEVVEIVEDNQLEDIPRHRHAPVLMSRVKTLVSQASDFVRRARISVN